VETPRERRDVRRPSERSSERSPERSPVRTLERPPARRGPKVEVVGKEEPLDLSSLPTIEVMKLDSEGSRRGPRRRKKGAKVTPEEEAAAVAAAAKRKRTGPRPMRPVPGATGRRLPSGGARPRSLVKRKPTRTVPYAPVQPVAKKISVHGQITVSQMADKTRMDGGELITKLLMLGSPLTLNEVVPPEVIELIANEAGFEVEFVPDTDESDVLEYQRGPVDDAQLKPRPPVVTIMGHVDHGKTSLLEQIAKLEVLDTEHGGITQHIGAYHVKTERGDVVFLDTPGHAAFTAMRQRGAQATDIVALVVAANDGVMPQTIEAINHSKAAGVPIIVVINKMDLPEANPDRVIQQLMTYELLPEELGGQTLYARISAKKGEGIDGFLETLLLQAEVLELRADFEGPANGVVIEAMRGAQKGIEATVLVQEGCLRIGDVLLAGQTFGRIRSMIDHLGRPIEIAPPSTPARLYGLTGEPPEAGEPFLVFPEERDARHIAEIRANRRRNADLGKPRHVSLAGLQDYLKDAAVKELRIILKGDVQGSIEAIQQSFEKIPSEKVKVRVLHSAVGSVSESDVRLAEASDAVILAFNVRPSVTGDQLAQQDGVEIKTYTVIYDLLGDVEKAMLGLLDVKYREEPQGRADVLEVFKVSRVGSVAGCMVTEGEIRGDANARLVRDGAVVYTGKVSSLRRVKEVVQRVQSGVECGIGLRNFNDVKQGDVIETFTLVEQERTLA
jgi:translation initiation factor IF-2